MKRILISTIAAATVFAAGVSVAQAETASSTFGVSVTLASRCSAQNAGISGATVAFGTYTAFGGLVNAAPALVKFDCTRGLAPVSFSFDATVGTAAGEGVLAGLNYYLTTSASSVGGSGATAAASGNAAGGNGTADVFTVSVGGVMPAGQSGQCGAANSTAAACDQTASHTRTLTVTY
jgi:spore coat protein U-like protein